MQTKGAHNHFCENKTRIDDKPSKKAQINRYKFSTCNHNPYNKIDRKENNRDKYSISEVR